MPQSGERLKAARVAIARACLHTLPPEPLGSITLRPEQRRIIARARRALEEHGGCLIGEDVGRGKTFIALALAQRWSNPLIVAPASLRSTWETAQERAGSAYAFVSHESLSQRRIARHPFDALIVDEAHHFRNPATVRHAELARMAATVPLLLLSATPLQNRARDLAAQIALFHGEGAFALPAEFLARFIIRGDDAPLIGMPAVAPPEWLPVTADDGPVLAAIFDLPAPARTIDGGDAGALRAIGLVRAWTSSRAALKAMLRSRRRVSIAIAQGLESDRIPTRAEARSWHSPEDVVQLGFASLLMQQVAESHDLAATRRQLDGNDLASERLSAALSTTPDPDEARIAAIRRLRSAFPQSRIVVFSEYASTVTAFFTALRSDAAVGMLTARGARIATGAIARDDLLARFAPIAQHVAPSAPHQSVTLLLATDLLSEGVNLQDASIVLHLDLPWNPARLSQRVGRLRRPGGADVVRSFLLAPPARAEALLDADARLRRKIVQAQHVVGVGFDVLPALTFPNCEDVAFGGSVAANASAVGAYIGDMERWSLSDDPSLTDANALAEHGIHESSRELIVGAAVHHHRGWLAALNDGRIVAALNDAPSESVDTLAAVVHAAGGEARAVHEREVTAAKAMLRVWLRDEDLLRVCGVAARPEPLRRAIADRLAKIIRNARRHEQSLVLNGVSAVRQHLTVPMPLGLERELLSDLTSGSSRNDGSVGTLAAILLRLESSSKTRGIVTRSVVEPVVLALIVIGPEPDADTDTTN